MKDIFVHFSTIRSSQASNGEQLCNIVVGPVYITIIFKTTFPVLMGVRKQVQGVHRPESVWSSVEGASRTRSATRGSGQR